LRAEKSPPKELVASEALVLKDKIAKLGASSRHWRSVVRDYWQSLHKRDQLRLPLSTAASCLPALREALLTASRTMLTTGVSRMSKARSVTAVTRVRVIFPLFQDGTLPRSKRVIAH
jgi:hypothetical protein